MTCALAMIGAVCVLSIPEKPEPMAFAYGKATNRAEYAVSSFAPVVPLIGPVLAFRPKSPDKQPERLREKRNGEGLAVLTAYAPTRSTVTLFDNIGKGKGKGKLFTLSDGNEQTGCLHKNKRLYTAMQKISRHFGKPLEIESAYRSPAYNAALRKRSKRVAKNSYHIKCAAIDFRIRGVSIKATAKYAATLKEVGGIGTYRSWVHIDSRPRKNGRITFW
jgi:hypothetical protein